LATFSATQTRRDKEKGHGNRVKRMCLAFASKRHCSVGGWVGGLMGWWVVGWVNGWLGGFIPFLFSAPFQGISPHLLIGGHFVRTLKRLANEICRSSVVRAKKNFIVMG